MSANPYDWLGKGIYFWEFGPQRAFEWAVWRSKNPGKNATAKIKTPAVLGAFIQLGNCFDLLDTKNTELLSNLFIRYQKTCEENHIDMPENKSPKNDLFFDQVLRYRDCAVLNWCLKLIEDEQKLRYDSVRCCFSEGGPAFEGSRIQLKSHIQIAVRNPEIILGFFKPPSLTFC